ncbi:transcriptional regulator with XRE-family HTH domain [Paraburkholderia sp. WSM4175]
MGSMGARIAVARTRREMSQSALARAVGVTPTAISKLESGETQMLRADHLLRIAAATGTDPVALVFGEDSAEYRRIAGSWPDSSESVVTTDLKPRERRLLTCIIQAFVDQCKAG